MSQKVIEELHLQEKSKELSSREMLFIRCGMLIYAVVLLGGGLCWSYPLALIALDFNPLDGLPERLATALNFGVSFVVFPTLIGTILCWYAVKWPYIPAHAEVETISVSPSSYIAPEWLHINPYAIISFVVGLVYIWFGSFFLIALSFLPVYDRVSPMPKHGESLLVFATLVTVAGVRRCILAVKKGRLPIAWEDTVTYSNYLPIWRMVVMSLITCGIYHLWWFADVVEHLKRLLHLKLRPGWRALGLIIPVCNSILAYQCFSYISQAADKAGVNKVFSPLVLTGWYTLVYAGMIYVLVFQWNSAIWAISVSLLTLVAAGTCMLAVVQSTINAIWLKEQQDLPLRDSFSKDQWSVVVCGWLMWGAVVKYLPDYWPG